MDKLKEPEIHAIIDEKGNVTIEVINFTGPACELLSKPYTDMFTKLETKKKAEYDQRVTASTKQSAKL